MLFNSFSVLCQNYFNESRGKSHKDGGRKPTQKKKKINERMKEKKNVKRKYSSTRTHIHTHNKHTKLIIIILKNIERWGVER